MQLVTMNCIHVIWQIIVQLEAQLHPRFLVPTEDSNSVPDFETAPKLDCLFSGLSNPLESRANPTWSSVSAQFWRFKLECQCIHLLSSIKSRLIVVNPFWNPVSGPKLKSKFTELTLSLYLIRALLLSFLSFLLTRQLIVCIYPPVGGNIHTYDVLCVSKLKFRETGFKNQTGAPTTTNTVGKIRSSLESLTKFLCRWTSCGSQLKKESNRRSSEAMSLPPAIKLLHRWHYRHSTSAQVQVSKATAKFFRNRQSRNSQGLSLAQSGLSQTGIPSGSRNCDMPALWHSSPPDGLVSTRRKSEGISTNQRR